MSSRCLKPRVSAIFSNHGIAEYMGLDKSSPRLESRHLYMSWVLQLSTAVGSHAGSETMDSVGRVVFRWALSV